MKTFVLDSYALIVFFLQQKDWKKVEHYLLQASADKIQLMISLINYGEIYYVIAQRASTEKADEIMAFIDQLPIEVVTPDKGQTLQAAKFKAKGGVAYSDCFAAALAKELRAKLVTGDQEFKRLEKEVTIDWIEK